MTKKVSVKQHLNKFGIKKLKEKQKMIINCFLKKKDTLGILPTGYGKSICYILPYLLKKKSVIVISPLISLMEDQKNKLKEKDIETIMFNSSYKHMLSSITGQTKYSSMLKCTRKYLLYFSPESFIANQNIVKNLIMHDSLSLIAIDECHCVSSWSDFRKDYKELKLIKNWINEYKKKIPILALTATATKDMIKDIVKKLKLDNPEIIRENVYRDNLIINVSRKLSFEYDIKKIKDYIDKIDSKGIIYCKTRLDTEKISKTLNLLGVKSNYYHAGLDNSTRNSVQEKFKSKKIKIIVATIAFGMGIDVSNINLIVHYGVSKNIESYYQEIGRGGRKGNKVNCYIFWSSKDFSTNRYFLSKIDDHKFRQEEMKKIIEIEKFINTDECRMKFICNYFGDHIEGCYKCDNCLNLIKDVSNNSAKKISSKNKSIVLRYFVIKTLRSIDYGLGITNFYKILKGSKTKNFKKSLMEIETYGQMKNKKVNEIKDIIKNTLYDGYLNEQHGTKSFGTFYKISKKGINWFDRNKDQISNSLKVLSKYKDKLCKKKIYKNLKIDKDVYNKLLIWRNKEAKSINRPSYCVLTNSTIENIIKLKPKNSEELLKVKGIGKVKISKYGESILNIIN